MKIKQDFHVRKGVGAVLFIFCCAAFCSSQDWTRMEVSDPVKKAKYSEFILEGKFVEAPAYLKEQSPKMILRCQPGRFSSGHLRGKLLEGVIEVGAPASNSPFPELPMTKYSAKVDPGGYYVELALDGGEPSAEHWDNLLNYQQVGFGSKQLNNILWKQESPVRENTASPVKKVVLSLQRYSTEKIVMQFDLPDSQTVSETCGCTYFK